MHRRVVAAGLGEHRLRGRRMRPGAPPGQELRRPWPPSRPVPRATSHAPAARGDVRARALATPARAARRRRGRAKRPARRSSPPRPSRRAGTARRRGGRGPFRPGRTSAGRRRARPSPGWLRRPAGVVGPQREDPRQRAASSTAAGRPRPVAAPAPVRRRRGCPHGPAQDLHEPRERGDLRRRIGRQRLRVSAAAGPASPSIRDTSARWAVATASGPRRRRCRAPSPASRRAMSNRPVIASS